MIIDTSALIAILRDEPAAGALREALIRPEPKRISTGTLLEAAIVVDANNDPVLSNRLDDLLAIAEIEPVPVTAGHVDVARAAYRNFGKGSGHPAGLNFGDCFAYALARVEREQLLFVGDDFGHTDVIAV